jgi:aminobutyraldehyde dehydrogenase
MVSLTGSIATGANIIASTADSVKRMHMELGGKAPVIIFDDADIDAAVEGIRTFGFYNAGQDCTAACRIYAQADIYDAFVEKLGAAVASIKYGLQDDLTELGPLITAQHRDRVVGFVERAVAQPHIRLITGRQGGGRQRLLL